MDVTDRDIFLKMSGKEEKKKMYIFVQNIQLSTTICLRVCFKL